MPTYEYRCEKCQAVLTLTHAADVLPRVRCGPDCVAPGKPGDGPLVKQLSSFGFRVGSRLDSAPAAAAPTGAASAAGCGPGCDHDSRNGSCEAQRVRRKYGLD